MSEWEDLPVADEGKVGDLIWRLGAKSARERLDEAWIKYYFDTGHYPRRMYVGRKLYEKYESELMSTERFISFDESAGGFNGGLKFRYATLWVDGPRWDVVRCE